VDKFTIESYLDSGHLRGIMTNGKLWGVRRNGKTQLWKTRPQDFRIPIKAGLRAYGEITPRTACRICEIDGQDLLIIGRLHP
jgi:hypothetical protein